MKKLLFVLILLSCTSSQTTQEQPVTVEIKPSLGGFEVYHGGELLLELTPTNTDPVSLETLRYIYDVASEKSPKSEQGAMREYSAIEIEHRQAVRAPQY